MSRLLTHCGHSVEIAINGSVGVKYLKEKRNSYDLVLMDLEMPIMDGYEATRCYREHELELGLSRLPIIAVSANDVVAVHQRCITAGMDDFIPKPFNLKQLSFSLHKMDFKINSNNPI